MEDQTAAVGEVGGNTIGVVLTGNGSSINGSTRSGTILPKEGDVVGLLDGDTSNLIETITRVHATTGSTILTVKDVGINLRDQGIVLTGGQHGHTTILRSSDFIKTGSSFKEGIHQSLSVILFVGAKVDLEATGLAGHSSSSSRGTVQNAEDTAIIELSQALTNLTGNGTTNVILTHDLIKVIHKGRGDQQVIQCDSGFSSRRITGTENRHTRSAITSRDTTGVNELSLFTTTQGPVHHQILSNSRVTEGFIHFARKELQEEASPLIISRRLATRFINGAKIRDGSSH